MKDLIACCAVLAVFASLCGCAAAPADQTEKKEIVVQENEYGTGSNIARRKNSAANVTAMTPEQAEEMRRSLQIRSPQSGGK